ncbi:STAS domain-containing protein [Streptomyces xantholiticus]
MSSTVRSRRPSRTFNRGPRAYGRPVEGVLATQTADLGVVLSRADGRVTVTVSGEIDICTGARLEEALDVATAYGAERIDVDFSGVSFCDCSGLSVLLRARRRAHEQGIAFRVTHVTSPVVQTLLGKTGTAGMLTGSDWG